MDVYISYINVNNLNAFLEYLKHKGTNFEEYFHTVLADSSEFEIIVCNRGESGVTYMFVHYIDTHYAVLSDIGEKSSDKEILQALLSVSKKNLWRISVEPIIYVTNDYDFIRFINSYVDSALEAEMKYLEKYLNSSDSIKKVIDINSILDIAYRIKEINGGSNETLYS
ncbi:MAG: hypothetical protein QW101_06915 [Ignisphaera sp.]|uniref:Uncharacterized protein n=1 Tax=Ignisphaera aggregans TaxID=334771 RepID=A0A7J3MYK9_9CREN